MKKSFLVIGLGRFGLNVVKTLVKLKADVLAVDINEERVKIRFFRIFKLIDIQRVNLDIGGFTNYYNRAINYGIIHSLFNIFSFIIQDQFIFNYNLEFYSEPKLKFECIIKSNLGKIIVGLLKRRIIK